MQPNSLNSIQEVEKLYPRLIPKDYEIHIKEMGSPDSLTLQFYPNESELSQNGFFDPIGDQLKSPTQKIIHRYKNRVLLTPTIACPINCRYCFRKNELLTKDDLFKGEMEQALSYIKDHKEIEEVILTGGDPLMLSFSALEGLLIKIKDIKHIDYVRIHSRVPIISPERLNQKVISLLKEFDITLIIHTNHVDEFNFKNKELIESLKGLRLFSQSVLLKGVNDSQQDLVSLFKTLTKLGVTPYYLHHPDQAQGTEHFWISLDEGKDLYAKLQDQLSGWMIPKYVIDSPDGSGKVSVFSKTT